MNIISIIEKRETESYICDYFCTPFGNVKGFTLDANKPHAKRFDKRDTELVTEFLDNLGCNYNVIKEE